MVSSLHRSQCSYQEHDLRCYNLDMIWLAVHNALPDNHLDNCMQTAFGCLAKAIDIFRRWGKDWMSCSNLLQLCSLDHIAD